MAALIINIFLRRREDFVVLKMHSDYPETAWYILKTKLLISYSGENDHMRGIFKNLKKMYSYLFLPLYQTSLRELRNKNF